jgi:hypothetical protein
MVIRRMSVLAFSTPLAAGLLSGALASIWDLVAFWVFRTSDRQVFWLLAACGFLKSLTLLIGPLICFRSIAPIRHAFNDFRTAIGWFLLGGICWVAIFHPNNFARPAWSGGIFPGPTEFYISSAFKISLSMGIASTIARLYQCRRDAVVKARMLGLLAGITFLASDIIFVEHGVNADWASFGFMALFFSNGLTGALPVLAVPKDQHQRLGWGISAKIDKGISKLTLTETPTSHFELGELYMRGKDYEAAITQFETVLQNDPGHAESLYLAAHCCVEANKREQALRFFESMVAHKDGRKLRFGLAWAEYAECLSAEGQEPRALEEFRKLVREYPRPRTELAYARFLKRTGRISEARTVLDDMLATSGDAPKEDRHLLTHGWLMKWLWMF